MNHYEIPVVWGVDKKYVLPACVVMHSILSHSNAKYHFFIITADNIQEQVKEYASLLKNKYGNFDVSVKRIDRKLFANASICNHHLSIAAYFRLSIPEILCMYDKCIYLDSDILVNGDLMELFDIDLGENYLAGVRDCHIMEEGPKKEKHREILGIPSMEKYINSGVLLINLKKMRDEGIQRKFFLHLGKENWYEDQDILNCCCYPFIKILPLKYNLFHFYYGKNICFLYDLNYEKKEFEFIEPFILHIGGEWKPWNDKRIKGADQWWQLAEIFRDTLYYQEYRKRIQQGYSIEYFLEVLEKNKEKKFVICGYSTNGKRLCDIVLAKKYTNVVAFMDNNPQMWGKHYCGICVKGIDQILEEYNNILWIISNQIAFDEVKRQIIDYGINDQFIVRWINYYDKKMYLLSLDEKNYKSEIELISEFEFVENFPEYNERKEHIMKVINHPDLFWEQYEYLNGKYHFQFWYHASYEKNENYNNYSLL